MFFIADVRYNYIKNQLLKLLQLNNSNNYPMDVLELFRLFPNCRVMTYQNFSKKYGSPIEDIILKCESNSGCTHYDSKNNKYLVLYNDSHENYNVDGRILWTLAHELGHIVLGHLIKLSSISLIAENNFNRNIHTTYEQEADFFASCLLAPVQLFEYFNVKSVIDVQNKFGLSSQASIYRWKDYLKWKSRNYQTPFDVEIIKIFN